MSLTTTFADLCKSFAPDAFAINYTLAKNPEISSQEFESVKTIGTVLEKYGMDVTYEFCANSLQGVCRESRQSKRSFGDPL